MLVILLFRGSASMSTVDKTTPLRLHVAKSRLSDLLPCNLMPVSYYPRLTTSVLLVLCIHLTLSVLLSHGWTGIFKQWEKVMKQFSQQTQNWCSNFCQFLFLKLIISQWIITGFGACHCLYLCNINSNYSCPFYLPPSSSITQFYY